MDVNDRWLQNVDRLLCGHFCIYYRSNGITLPVVEQRPLSMLIFVCGHSNSSLVMTLLLINIKRLENRENIVTPHHKNNTVQIVCSYNGTIYANLS